MRFPRLERRDLPVLYMRVEIEMISGEEEFINWIERICFGTYRHKPAGYSALKSCNGLTVLLIANDLNKGSLGT